MTFEEKRAILNSFPELIEKPISYGRYNYQFSGSKSRVKNVVVELAENHCGYVFVRNLVDFHEKMDPRGYCSIDKFNRDNLKEVIERVIESLK